MPVGTRLPTLEELGILPELHRWLRTPDRHTASPHCYVIAIGGGYSHTQRAGAPTATWEGHVALLAVYV